MDQQPPMPPPPEKSLFEMDMDALAQNHLNTISRWGKFIGITILIIVILCILGLAVNYREIINQLGAYMALSNAALTTIVAVLAVIGILAILGLIYLLRACSLIKQGLLSQNSDRIAEGFKALKTVFTVSIVFSVLSILTTLLTMVNP